MPRQPGPLKDDVSRWLESQHGDLVQAYDACRRPDWLVRIALAYDVPREAVVRAAAEASVIAMRRSKGEDLRPVRTVQAALRWASGEGRAADAWAAAFSASQAADELALHAPLACSAARAAAATGFACDPRADAFFYAQRAYAADAVEHASHAFGLARGEGRARCLEVVRKHITLGLLQSAARSHVA